VAFAVESADGTTMTGTMDEVVFAGQGDGTVAVTLPDSYPVTISGTGEDGVPGSAALTISHPGLSLVMSDAAEGGVATDYAAPEIAVTIEEIVEDGDALDFTGGVTMTGVEGRNARSGADMPEFDSSFSAAAVAAAFAGTDPESGGTFDMEIAAADVVSRSEGTGGMFYGVSNELGEMIDDGFTVASEGGSGEITFAFSAEDMPESFAANGRVARTEGALRIDAEQFAYDMGYQDISFAASGSDIPMQEVTGSLGEMQSRVAFPSTPTEEPQPMAFTLALRDLTLGESIWSLFDPTGALPRDPATLIVDLGGQIRFLADIFSEEEMADAAGPPAEVEALDIEELRLSLAGAEFTGTGAFTFDYDVPGPMGPGSPAPEGRLDLRLEGAQRLLETLVGMGILPEDQAMMVRMMTGMIARPAPKGGDALVSEITVEPDGTVLANGAPLPF
jgi:hypothetical protein